MIDQSAEARLVGLPLRETIFIVFGNPEGYAGDGCSTPLGSRPSAEGSGVEGQTKVSYVSPDALARPEVGRGPPRSSAESVRHLCDIGRRIMVWTGG